MTAIDDKISIATVYRTVKLFEEAGILVKHDFKAGKARYEINDDHNHLIDINSGEIVEFVDKDIEDLRKIAKKLDTTSLTTNLNFTVQKKKITCKKNLYKTFGCQMNEYDSNRIVDLVKKINYQKQKI